MSSAYNELLKGIETRLRAGIPLRDAVGGMAADGGGRLGALAGALHLKIEGGGTLSEALGGLDTRVPAGHAALIEAGESSGRLDETLAEIIAEEKVLTEARRRLLQRLAYPLLICCLAFLLPFLYLVLQGRTGEYLLIQSCFFVPLLLLFLALHYRREIFPPGSNRRRLVEQVILALPLVGGLVRQYSLAAALQLLGRLLRAGLGFSDGLPLVSKATGLRRLSLQLDEMAVRIAGGSSASEGLGCIDGIPADLRSRLASGDVSGTLDAALVESGKELREAALARLETVVKILPILAYLLAGGLVLWMALSAFSASLGGI